MWGKLVSSGFHSVWHCSIYFCYTVMPFVHALLRFFPLFENDIYAMVVFDVRFIKKNKSLFPSLWGLIQALLCFLDVYMQRYVLVHAHVFLDMLSHVLVFTLCSFFFPCYFSYFPFAFVC